MTRCSRRVVTNPHQRRQARWLETLDWAWPTRRVSSPADSSPCAWSSPRMRSRVGSPRARKYLATRSLRAGASGRRNGASWATDTPFQNFLIVASAGGHPLVNSKSPPWDRRRVEAGHFFPEGITCWRFQPGPRLARQGNPEPRDCHLSKQINTRLLAQGADLRFCAPGRTRTCNLRIRSRPTTVHAVG